MKPFFDDAQELHRKHPQTFYAPSADELSVLTKGDYIKVCTGDERFWVQISSVNSANKFPTFKGVVYNELVNKGQHGLSFGDEVRVPGKCVYDYLPEKNLKNYVN